MFDLVFRPQEQRVIEHTHSCYVLGRSGTGYRVPDYLPTSPIELILHFQKDHVHTL